MSAGPVPHELARGNLAVIGPGRVGSVLAAALVRAGHRVVAVAGGSETSRERFITRIAGVRSYADPASAAAAAALVVIATPDDAIEAVVTAIALADVLTADHRVVHVSGARGVAPLRRAALAGARVAACHPAQTFPARDASPDLLLGTPWAVTADEPDRAWARDLVTQLGGDPQLVPEDARVLYHAALTVGSNAVGAVVSLARQLLVGARVADPAAFLGPLVTASVGNALEHGAAGITGPVVRGDAGTLRRHLAALDEDLPPIAAAYRELTRVVLTQVRPALTAEQIAAVEAAVAPVGGDVAPDLPLPAMRDLP